MPITGVDRATPRARRWKGIGSGREGGREGGGDRRKGYKDGERGNEGKEKTKRR